MPAASAPTTEIGYAQAPNYNWWQYQDETTVELQWPQSISVYDAMRRTDAQVTSVLRAMTLPVRATPWRVDPDGASDEVSEFIADCLGLPVVGQPAKSPLRQQDRFSWDEHLRLSLLMLPFGHMYFEQVYRVDDDGKARIRKLGPRMPKTIERIDVADDGGLISISQYWTTLDRRPRPIPVNRLVAYIHEREGGNWLGQSILRPGYKNWLLKDRLLRVQAQTIERNGMGIPLYKGQDQASPADLAAGKAMATAWRSGEAAGSSIPFGADLTLVGVSGTLPDAEPAIRYHDEQLGRAVLAHFLNLGTQTGSWALGTTFADFFTLSLQSLAMQVADTATRHIVEDLVDINWGPDEPAPRVIFDEIGSRQPATAQSLVALFGAGALTPDERLEESLRQQYGLPPRQSEVDTGTDLPLIEEPPTAVTAGADQHVRERIDVRDTVEPGQFDADMVDSAALVAALADFCGEIHAEADFNPDLHPRGAGGRFRSTFARIQRALTDWGNGDGPDDPLHDFPDREPLRQAAVKRGVKLKRGALREEIVDALLADARGKRAGTEDVPKPRASFTLKGGAGKEGVAPLSAETRARLAKELHFQAELFKGAVDATDRETSDRLFELAAGVRTRSIPDAEVSDRLAALAKLYDGQVTQDNLRQWSRAFDRKGRGVLRDLDVGVYVENKAGSKIYLRRETNGRPGTILESFDDLDAVQSWAEEHGETELAGWAAKERDGSKPVAKAAPAKRAPAKKAAPEAAPTADIAAAIRQGGSEGEIVRLLDAHSTTLTPARLRELAADLGIDVPAPARTRQSIQSFIAPEASRLFGRGDGRLVERAPKPTTPDRLDPSAVAERLAELLGGQQELVDAMADVTTVADLRRVATALNLPLPRDRRFTPEGVRQYIAENMVRDRARWGLPGTDPRARYAPKSAAPPAEQAARDRQALIDKASAAHDTVAEVEQLLTDGASDRALKARITSRTTGQPATRDRLLAAVGDEPAMRQVLADIRREEGLTPIGEAGAGTRFDPALHESIGGDIPLGAAVTVVRPGHRLGDVTFPARVEAGEPLSVPEVPARPSAPAGVDVAALVAAYGGRAAFAHEGGNFLDEVERDLASGMSPGAVADRVNEREQAFALAGPFDSDGRLAPDREDLARRLNTLAVRLRQVDPEIQGRKASQTADRRRFEEIQAQSATGYNWGTTRAQDAAFSARERWLRGEDHQEIAADLHRQADALHRLGVNSMLVDDRQEMTGVLRHDQATRDRAAISEAKGLHRLADAIAAAGPLRPVPATPRRRPSAPSVPTKATPAAAAKLTDRQIVDLPDAELAQAAADGRVSRLKAARQLRDRAQSLANSAALIGLGKPDSELGDEALDRRRVAAERVAAVRQLADEVEAAAPAKVARPAKKAAPKIPTSDISTSLVDAGDDASAISAILAPLNSSQLKELARSYGIRGASKMNRAQLMDALTGVILSRNLASGAGETIAESAAKARGGA